MCGRFFLDAKAGDIIEHYNAPPPDLFTARYNIAPTTPVLAFGEGKFGLYRWGLIPSWAKDLSMGNRMFNARAETVAEKPSFRNAYKRRRCLVPANGYYEWATRPHGKQPYLVHRPDDGCFAIAGLWEYWERDGNVIESCALLTCAANATLAVIHHRMPVIIEPDSYSLWLDESAAAKDAEGPFSPGSSHSNHGCCWPQISRTWLRWRWIHRHRW